MKYYDYRKAEKLMEKKGVEVATLGMLEDWEWTAKEITLTQLKKFKNEETEIAGISGSIWATPSIELEDENYPCWICKK